MLSDACGTLTRVTDHTSRDDAVVQPTTRADAARQWWHDAVIYQVYPRSFADLDGNGIGDLKGVTSRVPYLRALGVDAVWLSPFYPSALADGGYDVDDHRDVAPEIGTMADFDEMVAALHGAGIRVLVDIVPNHTSDRHAWFRAALAGGPDAPERRHYVIREGTGADGELPPNDWRSLFGGSIWERIDDVDAAGRPLTGPGTGRPYQWYMHLFASEQPDLNWEDPAVHADFIETLRFWCDHGVDGFRIDVASGLAKDLSQLDRPWSELPWPLTDDGSHPLLDRDEVHAIYAEWRPVLESYDPPRFAVAEAGVMPNRRAAYARSVGQAFNFQMQDADFTSASYEWAISAGLADLASSGSTTWVLGCHDVVRVASRYGFDPTHRVPVGDEESGESAARTAGVQEAVFGRSLDLSRRWLLADGDDARFRYDADAGRRRAAAGALAVMALPGSMYVWQGDELGLLEVPDIVEERLQDPIATRNRAVEKGRDGCRVPLPWTASGTSCGFGPDGGAEAHLPQPGWWGGLSVERQEAEDDSFLSFYRRALAARRALVANSVGGVGDDFTWVRREEGVLAFARSAVQSWTAFGAEVELPDGRVLVSSAPVEERVADDGRSVRVLPADATAWVRVEP